MTRQKPDDHMLAWKASGSTNNGKGMGPALSLVRYMPPLPLIVDCRCFYQRSNGLRWFKVLKMLQDFAHQRDVSSSECISLGVRLSVAG